MPPGDPDNSITVNVTVPRDWCCDICSENIALIRTELLLGITYSTPPRVAVTATSFDDWEDSSPPLDCDNSAVLELADHLSGRDGSQPTPLNGVSITPSPLTVATPSSVTPKPTALQAPFNPYASRRIFISQPQVPTNPISRPHAAAILPLTPRAALGDITTQYSDDGSKSFVNGAVTTIPPMISTASKRYCAC